MQGFISHLTPNSLGEVDFGGLDCFVFSWRRIVKLRGENCNFGDLAESENLVT